MKYFLAFLLAIPCTLSAATGDDSWSLQRCVSYALAHNISIQQSQLNERLAALTLRQSKLSQLPNANVSTGYGISYGRSIDPTTNQFVSGSYQFTSLGGQADVLLFGWFQRRNTIAKNDLAHKAAQSDVSQLQDDVSLNVATGFLRALLAKEQIGVAQKQVDLSEKQYSQTRKFADAGRVPELNVAQLSSQLASDSSALISAIGDYNAAILDLKALLNLDFEQPFEIQPPEVNLAELAELSSYSAEDVYEEAHKHFGGVKSAQLKVESAQKGYQAAKGNLWPTITANAQVGTNFATTYKDYGTPVQSGTQFIGNVDVGGTQYPINAPQYTVPVLGTTPYFDQYNNNLRQTYSLNLNVPLFNGWSAQSAVRQAEVSMESQRLTEYSTELKLKQDIYKAVNDATSSSEKYKAAIRAQDAAQTAYDFAEKRYDLGLTNTVEYLVTQNSQFKADAAAVSAKYDLIFRLKVIEYYLGRAMKL
ncbi:MAG: TolC family protein [Chitinophagaceae bacterium]